MELSTRQGRSLIFRREDRTFEVNKYFIIEKEIEVSTRQGNVDIPVKTERSR